MRFDESDRRALLSAAAAELCLFKYDADPTSDTFGMPLEGPPHAIYLDPQEASIAHGSGEAVAVLNRGKGLRPSGDARGWKWRDQVAAKRDGSLLLQSESKVAHVKP